MCSRVWHVWHARVYVCFFGGKCLLVFCSFPFFLNGLGLGLTYYRIVSGGVLACDCNTCAYIFPFLIILFFLQNQISSEEKENLFHD